MIPVPIALAALMALGGLVLVAREARKRGVGPWIFARGRRPGGPGGEVHLLLCVADHYEPYWGDAPAEVAGARVARWVSDYPRLFGGFRDSDGRPPRHSFFYPIDQYDPAHVDALAGLRRAGFGEVEVHLHHHDDTSENLRATLLGHKRRMAEEHGIGSVDRVTGESTFAFIHGDWALDNSRPDGRCCGVDDELDVLVEAGCHADLTMPSYPSPTQTSKVNSLYYAVDDPGRPKSHDRGVDLGSGPRPGGSLLMIQGPLAPDWSRRAFGLIPRVENGCIQGNQPASIGRLGAWLRAGVGVPSRPDWVFVKLHTHGAPEANQAVLLGPPMVEFHRDLARRSEADPRFHYHYVTAREMANLALAAEAGWPGDVEGARDFRYVPIGPGSPSAGPVDRAGRAQAGLGPSPPRGRG